MPAAGAQSTENRMARRRLIEVEGLRIEFGSEREDHLRRFIAGFLMQLGVEPAEIVNNAITMDYIVDLTSGVTGRIVELLRQSARVTLARETAQLSVADLQHAGKFFAADIGSDRNVSH
jgi:hypothetical protein